MIGISDKQVLEHFKVAFLPKREVQLLEINDIDIAAGKSVLCYNGVNTDRVNTAISK